MRHECTLVNGEIINVTDLIKYCSKHYKVKKILINNIKQVFRSKKSGFSINRYKKADLKFPIILNQDFILIDGRHRTLKAIDNNRKYIFAYIIKDDILFKKIKKIRRK